MRDRNPQGVCIQILALMFQLSSCCFVLNFTQNQEQATFLEYAAAVLLLLFTTIASLLINRFVEVHSNYIEGREYPVVDSGIEVKAYGSVREYILINGDISFPNGFIFKLTLTNDKYQTISVSNAYLVGKEECETARLNLIKPKRHPNSPKVVHDELPTKAFLEPIVLKQKWPLHRGWEEPISTNSNHC